MRRQLSAVMFGLFVATILCLTWSTGDAMAQEQQDQTLASRVTFPSADGRTVLIGYLFEPKAPTGKAPAIVLLHGRAGAYSSEANGVFTAATLTRRHKIWASQFAQDGFVVLLVDSFGPRGYPEGFPKGSYDERPDAVSEVAVRPFDAYGALRFLRSRRNVDGARIGLMGWSNGGSAVLATIANGFTSLAEARAKEGFRAAVALYPGCGLQHKFDAGYRPYAPVRVFIGTADEEVSPQLCGALVKNSRSEDGDIALTIYDGATHDFDDPGTRRQSLAANRAASGNAAKAILSFFEQTLMKH